MHKDLAYEFDFTGIGPYPGEREYNLFIKNNPTVNLKVYYPNPFRKNFITGCFKTPVIKGRPRLIELFLDKTWEGEGHYSAIRSKSALLSKQMTRKKMKKCYFCDRCDNVFKCEKHAILIKTTVLEFIQKNIPLVITRLEVLQK